MKKVLVLDNVQKKGVNILEKNFSVDEFSKIPQDELLEKIKNYSAVIVRSQTKITKEIIDQASNLQVIGRAGVGVDNIDVEHATRKGIIVVNSPDGNTIAAAEHSIALIMSLARNVPNANSSLKSNLWERKNFVGVELYKKTIGIVGLGRIGSHVAKICKSFGMNLIGYDPYINEKSASERGIKKVDLEELFTESDFITVHIPKTNETENLINLAAMKKMKDSVRIINCSRGGIINEDDLVTAINEKIIGGAALDVFETEPLKDSPLQSVKDNLIITPHLGASTKEAQVNVSVDVAEQVTDILSGKQISNAVNLTGANLPNEIKNYASVANKIGQIAGTLSDKNINEIEISYLGNLVNKNSKKLSVYIIRSILSLFLKERVNLVNAKTIASERGIDIKEITSSNKMDYKSLITVKIKTDDQETIVSGTLLGEQEERIVKINDFSISFVPSGKFLITTHMDKPGMIGKIGTILGEQNINIAKMDVGRDIKGNASMVMNVDSSISEGVIKKVNEVDGIITVKQLLLDD